MAASPPLPLAGPFVLWSDRWRLQRSSQDSPTTYALADVQPIATIPDTEALADALQQRPIQGVPVGGSLHLFREGVHPVYDDPTHIRGGHFKMQAITRHVAPRCWARLAAAFTSGRWHTTVTGVTYMRAHQTTGFKVWVSDARDRVALTAVRKAILATLSPREEIHNLKFSPHIYILHNTSSTTPPSPAPYNSSAGFTSSQSSNFPGMTAHAATINPPRSPADSATSAVSSVPSGPVSTPSEGGHSSTEGSADWKAPFGRSYSDDFNGADLSRAVPEVSIRWKPYKPTPLPEGWSPSASSHLWLPPDAETATPSPTQRVRQKLREAAQQGARLLGSRDVPPVLMWSWVLWHRRFQRSSPCANSSSSK